MKSQEEEIDLFDEFKIKPMTEGLGFHEKSSKERKALERKKKYEKVAQDFLNLQSKDPDLVPKKGSLESQKNQFQSIQDPAHFSKVNPTKSNDEAFSKVPLLNRQFEEMNQIMQKLSASYQELKESKKSLDEDELSLDLENFEEEKGEKKKKIIERGSKEIKKFQERSKKEGLEALRPLNKKKVKIEKNQLKGVPFKQDQPIAVKMSSSEDQAFKNLNHFEGSQSSRFQSENISNHGGQNTKRGQNTKSEEKGLQKEGKVIQKKKDIHEEKKGIQKGDPIDQRKFLKFRKKESLPEVMKSNSEHQKIGKGSHWHTVKHSSVGAFLMDSFISFGLLVIFLTAFLVFLKTDFKSLTSGSQKDVVFYLSFGVLYLATFFFYLIFLRSFFGKTLGEWVFNFRLGSQSQRQHAFYPFLVFWRILLIFGTGIFFFSILSFLFKKDILFYFTGLKVYKKS